MALIKKLTDSSYNEYEYHRITEIDLPRFKKNIGWSQASVVVTSYKSKEALDAGAELVRIRLYQIPFAAIPGIVFDSQEALLAWAYTNLKPYLDDLEDAENDNIKEPDGSS